MPEDNVGYSTTCVHCGRQTDVVWARPTHLCQVCGNAFCKKCGISYVCKSCVLRRPPDIQKILIKKARNLRMGTAYGLLSWFGGIVFLIVIFTNFGFLFQGNNTIWGIIITIGGITFFCGFGTRYMWGGNGRIMRLINRMYFEKNSYKLNFTGIVATGEVIQEPISTQQPPTIIQRTTFEISGTSRLNPPITDEIICLRCGGRVNENTCQTCFARICPKCGFPDSDKTAKVCNLCGHIF
ncbi:MAG: hypothetical protein RBG13Loki_3489 [Promethearchaeota archaeon CR_4]|nr:MAG: hypothetical protein RBG13Loki_3489 [Candidatus Lokiarchaeota archaeon CR_4]